MLAPSCSAFHGRRLPDELRSRSAGHRSGLYNSTANYSYNLAPDILAKLAFQPRFGGHYEIFGIARFFRDRVYPNALGTGSYNDTTTGGGIGGGFRIPVAQNKVEIALHGLYGKALAATAQPRCPIPPCAPTASSLSCTGSPPWVRLLAIPPSGLISTSITAVTTPAVATSPMAPEQKATVSPLLVNTGCTIEVVPGSGGYSPSSPANCAGVTKDLQEPTFGYWYNIYDGSHGRLRQGFQYSYVERNAWSGVGGSANGNRQCHRNLPPLLHAVITNLNCKEGIHMDALFAFSEPMR